MAAKQNNNQNFSSAGGDYLMTLHEVCEALGKSSRTITRYVRQQILRPREVKSRQGTLEYRFSRREVNALRDNQKSRYPYLFDENDQPNPLPNYTQAQANFASYGVSPAVSPAQPFLVPGVAFPMSQPQYPQSPPQNFYPQAFPQGPEIDFEPDFDFVKKGKQKQKTKDKDDIDRDREPQIHANDEIVSLLKETTEMLRGQLKAKDDQIKNLDDKIGQLIERNRETNILLKGLQDKIMLLEQPKPKPEIRDKETIEPRAEEKLFQTKERQPVDKQAAPMDEVVPRESQIAPRHELPVPVPDQKNSKASDDPKKKGLFGKIFG